MESALSEQTLLEDPLEYPIPGGSFNQLFTLSEFDHMDWETDTYEHNSLAFGSGPFPTIENLGTGPGVDVNASQYLKESGQPLATAGHQQSHGFPASDEESHESPTSSRSLEEYQSVSLTDSNHDL